MDNARQGKNGAKIGSREGIKILRIIVARKNKWGECANDFRTFLLSQPELPCPEWVSGWI
jgi:hypothetical protein